MPAIPSSSRDFLISNRTVLAIAIPMTLGYLTTPLVGLVDMAAVGQLADPAALGGVALGALLFDVLFTTFNFLRSGTTGLTAQAVGRGDLAEQRLVLLRALVIAGLSGSGFILLSGTILTLGIAALGGSPAVQVATAVYFGVRVLAAPISLANYAVLGWLLGLGRAGLGLAVQSVLNGVNIVLSLALVLKFGFGVAGAAWAAVAAEATALALGVGLVLLLTRRAPWPPLAALRDGKAFRAMLAVNADIMIRSFVLMTAFAFFSAQSARQGDVVLAANVILEKYLLFAAYFLDGFAAAAETFVGRAVGARYRPAYDQALKLTVIWSFVLSGALSLALAVAGPTLVALMTAAEDVRVVAAHYLGWSAAAPLVGVLAFLMDGVFIGATWSRDMRNMMLVSLAVYFAAWALLFPPLGNHGLWIALLVFFGIRGLSLLWVSRARAAATFA